MTRPRKSNGTFLGRSNNFYIMPHKARNDTKQKTRRQKLCIKRKSGPKELSTLSAALSPQRNTTFKKYVSKQEDKARGTRCNKTSRRKPDASKHPADRNNAQHAHDMIFPKTTRDRQIRRNKTIKSPVRKKLQKNRKSLENTLKTMTR